MRIFWLERESSLDQPSRLLGSPGLERQVRALREQARVFRIRREESEVAHERRRRWASLFRGGVIASSGQVTCSVQDCINT